MRQRCDETGTKWIICYSEDNRNSRSCLLRRGDCRSRRHNDIHLEPHELIGNRGVALFAPLRPAIFDSDCSTFDPAKLVQPLHKSSDPRAPSRKSSCAEKPDRPELRSLLRECHATALLPVLPTERIAQHCCAAGFQFTLCRVGVRFGPQTMYAERPL